MPISCDNHARIAFKKLVFLALLLLATPALACNLSSAAGPVTPTVAPSLAAPTLAMLASPTALLATQLPATQPPTIAPAPVDTQQPPAPPDPVTVMPELQTVKIFLVATGDNGASGKLIGCGDSLVPVTQQIVPTQGVLRAAVEIFINGKPLKDVLSEK
jgi:hypothetical protein